MIINKIGLLSMISAFFLTLLSAHSAHAQSIPSATPTLTETRIIHPAHWAARSAGEIGFGLLLGTAAGGTALITGMLINPRELRGTLIASALLYPAGVASGAILGGWLTDSQSTYWEPFVGAYAGALIADITAYFISDEYPTLSAVLVIALPVLTALAAMEGSHIRRKRSDTRETRTVMPFSLSFAF